MENQPVNKQELLLRIQLLENRQKTALVELEEEAEAFAKSFHPLQLLTNGIEKAASFDNWMNLLKNSVLSVGSGIVSSKLFGSQKGRPLRKIIGSAVVFGLTNLVLKNPTVLKVGIDLIIQLTQSIRAKKAASATTEKE